MDATDFYSLITRGKRVIAHIKSRFHTHDIQSGKKTHIIFVKIQMCTFTHIMVLKPQKYSSISKITFESAFTHSIKCMLRIEIKNFIKSSFIN